MDMKIDYVDIPGGVEITISGELLFLDSQTFMQKIPMMVEGKGVTIRMDLKNLRFIDSSGLGAILYVSEALRMQGQKLTIRNVNDNNMKLLKVIQNVGTFTIEG